MEHRENMMMFHLICHQVPFWWGTSKQHMKLQQPRNYDFRVSQFDPPRSQSGNDRETTTKVATTVKRRLLHLAIIERQIITLTTTAKPQQLRVNSREMTTFAASCNDREMQRPRSDKFETAQLLQILHKILCRVMAVVVSSAFWKSLIWCTIRCKMFLEIFGCGCVWAVPDF